MNRSLQRFFILIHEIINKIYLQFGGILANNKEVVDIAAGYFNKAWTDAISIFIKRIITFAQSVIYALATKAYHCFVL